MNIINLKSKIKKSQNNCDYAQANKLKIPAIFIPKTHIKVYLQENMGQIISLWIVCKFIFLVKIAMLKCKDINNY